MLSELSKVDTKSRWHDEEAFWNSDLGFDSNGDRGFDACATCLGCECKVSLRPINPEVLSEELLAMGYSMYRCRSCSAPFTDEQVRRFRSDFTIIICDCGDKMNLVDSAVSVHSDSVSTLDLAGVKNAVWYHATESENWLDSVKDLSLTPYVHIGTRKAAMDRAKQIANRTLRRSGVTPKIWMWEVTVDAKAVVAESVIDDDDDWLNTVTECSVKGLGGNVVRYVNRYESTGSVSLLIDPNFVSSMSVEEISSESIV